MEGWAFKFENMAAAVVPSSRDTLDWAAQQDTPILNVDDVEAGPDSVEINPQVYVALAELLEGEVLDIVQNTTRGAGLEAWRKFVRRFDPQTVGRKRTLLSRIVFPGTVKVHELSRAIEQWEEKVNRLARHGEEYQLNESFKKVALKKILVGKILDNFNVLGIEELGPRQALLETLIVEVDAANVLVFLLGHHGWVDCGTEGRARAGADCLGHEG